MSQGSRPHASKPMATLEKYHQPQTRCLRHSGPHPQQQHVICAVTTRSEQDMHNLVFWILGARSQLRDGPSMIVPSHQATHHIKKSCSQQLFLALFRIYTYRYLDLNSICECPCTDTLRSGTSEVWPSVTGTVLTWLWDKSITSRCTSLWKQTG